MKVQVTQAHINAGKPRSLCNCPVAKALNDVFKTDNAVVGCGGFFTVNRIPFKRSPEVQQFQHNFDSAYEVKPFEFEAIPA